MLKESKMFVPCNNKDELIKELEKRRQGEGKVVIHFNCPGCDNEILLGPLSGDEIEDAISSLEKHERILTFIECINCEEVTKIVDLCYIQGVEDW